MPELRFAAPEERRVALVTGGARGIGRAIALRLAADRYSDPEEVAEVAAFLCSERNTYTTGSIWSVKGGSG